MIYSWQEPYISTLLETDKAKRRGAPKAVCHSSIGGPSVGPVRRRVRTVRRGVQIDDR
jgi:hypothetical protein